MESSSQPRVFVSSTIHDFRDLRSALKFWLEEFGCQVQMSEHADFGKSLDSNSYEACLKAIDQCDYFVLFIGARVGGWYRQSERISITRAEYQYAYERFKSGLIRLIPFVRKDLWVIREDRNELSAFLRNGFAMEREIDSIAVDQIVKHPSKFVNDAETIFSFIDEVARAEEMKQAIDAGSTPPKGNWLHVFDSFEDVTATLRQSLGLKGNLRKRGIIANLKNELVANLSSLLENKDGYVRLRNTYWHKLRQEFLAQVSHDLMGTSEIEAPMMNSFCAHILGAGPYLDTMFLEEAVRSGEFLEYRPKDNALLVGPSQEFLVELLEEIKSYRRSSEVLKEGKNLLVTYGSKDAFKRITVQNCDLFAPLFWLESQDEVISKLIAVYSMLIGQKVEAPPRRRSVLEEHFSIPMSGKVSIVDAESWLGIHLTR